MVTNKMVSQLHTDMKQCLCSRLMYTRMELNEGRPRDQTIFSVGIGAI